MNTVLIKLGLVASVVGLLIGGFNWQRDHYIHQGEQSKQAEWDKKVSDDRASAASAKAEAERVERQKEQAKQAAKEKIDADQVEREKALRTRAGAAAIAERKLLDYSAELDRRADELSRASEDPGLIGLAREAITARELFGSCVARYRELATGADGLRNQVDGLQKQYAEVCQAAPATTEAEASE